jgi:hypothetical protein
MLDDPLIQMVMRSDNVSEQDHCDLLFRVARSLTARARDLEPCEEALA